MKPEILFSRKILNFLPVVPMLVLVGCAASNQSTAASREIDGEKMLLGIIQYQDILHTFPDWKAVDEGQTADPELVKQLQALDTPLKVECYLGTWCGDSRNGVPSFMKMIEAANNQNIAVTLVGVDRDKIDPEQSALQHHVQRVPTFIVYQQDQEIGRLIEFPLNDNFVADLLDLLDSK